jgi:hypothetical protein
MVAQQLVLNYCRRARHFESLYFASVANNILWWTFVKACFNVVWGLIGGAPCPKRRPHIAVLLSPHPERTSMKAGALGTAGRRAARGVRVQSL